MRRVVRWVCLLPGRLHPHSTLQTDLAWAESQQPGQHYQHSHRVWVSRIEYRVVSLLFLGISHYLTSSILAMSMSSFNSLTVIYCVFFCVLLLWTWNENYSTAIQTFRWSEYNVWIFSRLVENTMCRVDPTHFMFYIYKWSIETWNTSLHYQT